MRGVYTARTRTIAAHTRIHAAHTKMIGTPVQDSDTNVKLMLCVAYQFAQTKQI